MMGFRKAVCPCPQKTPREFRDVFVCGFPSPRLLEQQHRHFASGDDAGGNRTHDEVRERVRACVPMAII